MTVRVDGQDLEVIDVHCHVGSSWGLTWFGFESATWTDRETKKLIKDLDEAGVDKVCAFSTANPQTDYSPNNRLIAQMAKDYPSRVIPFIRINPHFGAESAQKSFKEFAGNLNFKGLKLHPQLDAFTANNRYLLRPVLEEARRYRLPVLIHTGEVYTASPGRVGDLAEEFTDVNFIAAHLGMLEWEEAISVAKKHENVYVETSSQPYIRPITMAVQELGEEKVMFGCDSPFQPYLFELEKLTKHAKLKVDELKYVLSGNVKRLTHTN